MVNSLRVAFAGTPRIASDILSTIINAGYLVCVVLTKADAKAGRGQHINMSAVKALSIQHGIPVLQPNTLNDRLIVEQLQSYSPDIMVVVAYGLIIPQAILDVPTYGCVNIHMSLLPLYRGAAPIERAILNGDDTTGVTLIKMNDKLDAGEILMQNEVNINEDDCAIVLSKLAQESQLMIVHYLSNIMNIVGVPQNHDLATYAPKILKSDTIIDWNRSADQIIRQIRAYSLLGCRTLLSGKLVKIYAAKSCNNHYNDVFPGSIVVDCGKMSVFCGDGKSIMVTIIQIAGGDRQDIKMFLTRYGNLVLNQTFLSAYD